VVFSKYTSTEIKLDGVEQLIMEVSEFSAIDK